jgi:hypothetical protein
MKRTVALFVMVCVAVVVAIRTHDAGHAQPTGVPAPTHIDAEFDPESNVMAITWDEPIAAGHGRNGYRYRYRRDGGRWSNWSTTSIAGIDLDRSHADEAIDIEVRARNADGDLSAVSRARVRGQVPSTFDCKAHPYGAYPSKCVAGATPPMGD